jgi:hypothetical protein
MLELRPNCENCDKDLPPESTEAYIPIPPQDACFRASPESLNGAQLVGNG